MRKYLGAVTARPHTGFGRFGHVISRGSPNLVLTQVVTALNNPPRYIIDISNLYTTNVISKYPSYVSNLAILKIRNLYFNILTTT